MKKVILITLALSLLFPGVAFAQDSGPTSEQIQQVQQQANDASGNAQNSSNQANQYRAQANAYDAQAAQYNAQAANLRQQAQDMADHAAAAKLLNQATVLSQQATEVSQQAASAYAQAKAYEVQASRYWILYSQLTVQVVQMTVQVAQQSFISVAVATGQIAEQGHTINLLNNQLENQQRLTLGAGLLALALLMAIILVVVRHNQRTVDSLTVILAGASRTNDMAVVQDKSIRSYRILEEIVDGSPR